VPSANAINASTNENPAALRLLTDGAAPSMRRLRFNIKIQATDTEALVHH
jgi:hypothetical protein